MKVLVTGSNGSLGSAVVERLILHGVSHIRCFLRTGSDQTRLQRLAEAYPNAQLEIFEGSLGSPESAKLALEDIDVVYHVAAGLTGTAADLFLNSVVASKNLLEAMRQTQFIKTVLVSSFGVYGVSHLKPGSWITEETPLEPTPHLRDAYSYSKWRQEKLFQEYQERYGLPLVVVRPGVIYSPQAVGPSARVGIGIGPLFLYLGSRNLLPLTHVTNCAEAVALAGLNESAVGQVYNIHDDDLPTCKEYLALIRRKRKLRVLKIGYPILRLLAKANEKYHRKTQGQIPALLTVYRVDNTWRGMRFDNRKLKSLGWKQVISTADGLKSLIS